jgi:hypothetical protein
MVKHHIYGSGDCDLQDPFLAGADTVRVFNITAYFFTDSYN